MYSTPSRTIRQTTPSSYRDLLRCRFCRRQLTEDTTAGRAYTCSPDCRAPINADWVDAQVTRALPPRIPLDRAWHALNAITVGTRQIHLAWFSPPQQRQPPATPHPPETFLHPPPGTPR
ncbi:hypothetical protein F4553_000097 [Allocatelliglobosispora scoriae]|uniref:Recombinase zinc beta ribbon domain-containing protein n=1 Tax=Allocatelliglobosispora scoriae TaxID=643052 RepID=A0A841BHC4_9ACTN|nr:hypothetical protein [Allocatelliglobosispora scoriae]MBB5866718.1 hypothetical protein [Allocatelliglobosispora scoriae]